MKLSSCAERDGYTVICLPGHLQQDDWLGFRDYLLRTFLAQGLRHLALDCTACPCLPSIAFGPLMHLSGDLQRAGGSLHLIHVSETTRQFLIRTRLCGALPVRCDLADVIRQADPREAAEP